MVDQVKTVVEQLKIHIELQEKRLARKIMELLPPATPKDTTFASLNWVPSIGQPFEGTAGTKAEALERILDTATQQSGIAKLASYKLIQGRIFITNNVPYISRLNDGHSGQAPIGFVQKVVATAQESVGRP